MKRRTGWTLLVLGAVLALGLVGAMLAYRQVGRTPGEIISYLERRLEGHPTLETVTLPVLGWARSALGEPGKLEHAAPWIVPPMAPNPALLEGDKASPDDTPGLIRVGPRRAFTRIAQAARAAQDGSIVEIDPGDYVADVAVWDAARLTIRGLGNRVRLIAAGASAEGKAIWVIRRGAVTIENIEFVGARVDDRNGAGIRLESGQLVVRRCRFFDNESGILTSGLANTSLAVEQSEFGWNGAGDGLSHGIYVGNIDSFRLSGSWVHHANVGHLVKSRARFNRVEYNRLTDESGGRASYELEFPNGGVAEVVGNIVQQGALTRNSVMLSYGAEGYSWPDNRLLLAHNTVVNDQPLGGSFVRVREGASAVMLRNNLFVGTGKLDLPAGSSAAGDRRADWTWFVRPSREDYRLADRGRAAAGEALAPLEARMTPRAQYLHPARAQPLDEPLRWPGAVQSGAP